MAQKKKSKTAKNKKPKKALKKSGSAKAQSQKYVYDFGKKTDGDATQRSLPALSAIMPGSGASRSLTKRPKNRMNFPSF